jgi:stage IV sporulation protein FB
MPPPFLVASPLFTICHMNQTHSLLTFSFPVGRLLGVPLRLSFLMPVVAVAVMWRMSDIVYGAIASVILLLSLLGHEMAHLLVARHHHCLPSSLVLWPLGGMQSGRSRLTFREAMAISLAGPLVNLVIAAICGWQLYQLDLLQDLLNPFSMFDVSASKELSHNCLRMAFLANYCLCLFNLIPVRPLDAGEAFQSFLSLRFVEMETRDLMLRIGLVVSLFGILSGFVFDVSSLVALSAFLLVLHLHDMIEWSTPPATSDTFLGYDFSEGYTSLNRGDDQTADDDGDEAAYGILDRWKARREDERLIRESEERELEEQQLDRILEKVHTDGRESLTVRELTILNRVSARLRQRHTQE